MAINVLQTGETMMNDFTPGTRYGRFDAVRWRGHMILTALAALLGALTANAAEKDAKMVIADKTLVAWVAPANLTRRGAG